MKKNKDIISTILFLLSFIVVGYFLSIWSQTDRSKGFLEGLLLLGGLIFYSFLRLTKGHRLRDLLGIRRPHTFKYELGRADKTKVSATIVIVFLLMALFFYFK